MSKTFKMNMNGNSSGFRLVNVTDIKLKANGSMANDFFEKSSIATGRVCSNLGKYGCIADLVVVKLNNIRQTKDKRDFIKASAVTSGHKKTPLRQITKCSIHCYFVHVASTASANKGA